MLNAYLENVFQLIWGFFIHEYLENFIIVPSIYHFKCVWVFFVT